MPLISAQRIRCSRVSGETKPVLILPSQSSFSRLRSRLLFAGPAEKQSAPPDDWKQINASEKVQSVSARMLNPAITMCSAPIVLFSSVSAAPLWLDSCAAFRSRSTASCNCNRCVENSPYVIQYSPHADNCYDGLPLSHSLPIPYVIRSIVDR